MGFRQTQRWKTTRAALLRREPWCRICRRAPATQVDHIRRVEDGGAPWDPANLQPVCGDCHKRKTAMEHRIAAAGRPMCGPDGFPLDLQREPEEGKEPDGNAETNH